MAAGNRLQQSEYYGGALVVLEINMGLHILKELQDAGVPPYVHLMGELPPGPVLDKGRAIKAGAEVIVSGAVENIALGMRSGHGDPSMAITMMVDDIVKRSRALLLDAWFYRWHSCLRRASPDTRKHTGDSGARRRSTAARSGRSTSKPPPAGVWGTAGTPACGERLLILADTLATRGPGDARLQPGVAAVPPSRRLRVSGVPLALLPAASVS